MIGKDELTRISRMKHLQLTNCEKDYLMDLVLFTIYRDLDLPLAFKGGTALYKLFNLNRFSEDLDFTLNARKFDTEKTKDRLLRSLKLNGIEGISSSDAHGNAMNIRFNLRGPLYNGRKESLCYILINISHRERIIDKVHKEHYVSSYAGVPSFDIPVMSQREMLSEKIRAITDRDKARDVYDLWFLLKKGTPPDIELIRAKFRLGKKTFSINEFKEAIERKRRLWTEDLKDLIMGDLPDFNKIKNEIIISLSKALEKT